MIVNYAKQVTNLLLLDDVAIGREIDDKIFSQEILIEKS